MFRPKQKIKPTPSKRNGSSPRLQDKTISISGGYLVYIDN